MRVSGKRSILSSQKWVSLTTLVSHIRLPLSWPAEGLPCRKGAALLENCSCCSAGGCTQGPAYTDCLSQLTQALLDHVWRVPGLCSWHTSMMCWDSG